MGDALTSDQLITTLTWLTVVSKQLHVCGYAPVKLFTTIAEVEINLSVLTQQWDYAPMLKFLSENINVKKLFLGRNAR